MTCIRYGIGGGGGDSLVWYNNTNSFAYFIICRLAGGLKEMQMTCKLES